MIIHLSINNPSLENKPEQKRHVHTIIKNAMEEEAPRRKAPLVEGKSS